MTREEKKGREGKGRRESGNEKRKGDLINLGNAQERREGVRSQYVSARV